MALSEEKAAAGVSRVSRAVVSVVTENGFTIVRTCDVDADAPSIPGKHCFVVQDDGGAEHEVTVEFNEEATALVQRRRRSPLSPENSFWLNCAERSLATYLLEKNQLPPDGVLIIEDVCLDDLEVARRWSSA
jgi:hypothetical protein